MFDTIKSNLEMAIRLNDKVLFDIVMKQLTIEVYDSFTGSESFEISDLFAIFKAQNNPDVVEVTPNLPKACAIEDPTCENCSS